MYFLFLCLCIVLFMYVLFCTLCFHRANRHPSATVNEVLPFLSSVVRQIAGYNSQRRRTVSTVPNYFDHSGFEFQKTF